MEVGCTWAPVKEEKVVIPLVPPGFASLTSFTLKKVHEGVTMSCMESSCALDLQMTSEECHNISDDAKLTRTRRRKPWVNYSRFDNSSEEESDSEHIDQDSPPLCRLPKGVIRGCPECLNCQKVTAKWHPEDAQRPLLDDTPVFYPSEEEFKDTLKYIASIRSRAEPYGICRIVPPPSWNPPCPLREELMWENASFATRIQQIDKLQNRISRKRLSRYHKHIMRRRRKRLRMQVEGRTNNGDVVDANELGCISQAESFGFEPGSQFTLEAFQKYADDFKGQYFRLEDPHTNSLFDQVEPKTQWEPSVENVEGEYWRIVGKPTEEIDVLYGADIETGVFGSGFPKSSSTPMDDPYVKSGWNLNNVSKLPSSLLCFESGDISGVQVPWLYVGMCFSSFCWHVEDHHLYSLNYLHWGAPKMWYGVPGKDALKLEAAMKKHLPDLFEEQHDLLNKLVTQLSPSILKSEGVPVYRCVQNPGEFVLTFPRAYHSGFNCGFNCAEAVNVAPVDWLPHGQGAVELYREQVRKTSVSHDKLLLGAAREAVRAHWELFLLRKNTLDNLRWKNVCGKDGILLQALQTRVEMERLSRELLGSPSQSRKMDKEFDAINERECTVCFYDLHLSAAGCNCSPERFACLNHAKQLCKCAWSMRFFLFRYELSELNILVEALGGKLSAIHRWAYLDLGLTLSSVITKDKSHESSPSTEGSEQKGQGTVNAVCSIESERRIPVRINLTSNRVDSPLYQEINAAPLVLASKEGTFTHTMNMKEVVRSNDTPVPVGHLPKIKREEHKPQFVDVVSVSNPNFLTYSPCRPSKEDSSYMEPSESTASEKKPLEFSSSVCGIQPLRNKAETISKTVRDQLAVDSNVILLSDDDSEKSSPKSPELSLRLTNMDDKVTTCNYQKDESLNIPKSNGTVMSEREARLLPVMEKGKPFSTVFVIREDHGKDETGLESKVMMPNVSSTRSHSQNFSQNVYAAAVTSVYLKESTSNHATNAESQVQHPLPCCTGKPKDEGKEEKPELESSKIKDRAGSVTESLSGPANNLDRYYRQKGPRMAKVVRRVNCVVELLELGVVLSGKLWSNCRTIYPKGFRSRVRYLSVMDPTKMCYYVSEILDAGLIGPLFMVTVEQCPGEVFIQVSVTKCWDLVRERVNIEIRKQHNLGRIGLPPLQPPGCIDGFEMFGFSSPTIIQAIEAIDRGHVCLDYWQSRTEATSCSSGSLVGDHKDMVDEPNNDQDVASDADKKTSVGVEMVLRGLFKKANMVELHALHSMLSDTTTTSNQELLSQLLVHEFQERPKLNSSSNFT